MGKSGLKLWQQNAPHTKTEPPDPLTVVALSTQSFYFVTCLYLCNAALWKMCLQKKKNPIYTSGK